MLPGLQNLNLCHNFSFAVIVTLEATCSTWHRYKMEGATQCPSNFECMRHKLDLYYADIMGLLCDFWNFYPFLSYYPTWGCSQRFNGDVQAPENRALWTLAGRLFKRRPQSVTHLLLPPIFLQLGENVIKWNTVIMSLGSGIRNPGF